MHRLQRPLEIGFRVEPHPLATTHRHDAVTLRPLDEPIRRGLAVLAEDAEQDRAFVGADPRARNLAAAAREVRVALRLLRRRRARLARLLGG